MFFCPRAFVSVVLGTRKLLNFRVNFAINTGSPRLSRFHLSRISLITVFRKVSIPRLTRLNSYITEFFPKAKSFKIRFLMKERLQDFFPSQKIDFSFHFVALEFIYIAIE